MSFIADIFAANSAAKGQKQAAAAARDTSAASLAEQRRQYDLSRSDMQPWLQTGSNALGSLSRLYGLGGAQAPAQGQPQAMPSQGFGAVGGGGMGSGFAQRMGAMGSDGQWMRPQAMNQQGQPQVLPAQGAQPAPQPSGTGGQFDQFWQSPDYQYRMDQSMRALTARNAALGIQDSGAAQRSAIGLAGNLASSEYNNYANRLAALAGVGQSAANSNANLGSGYANAVTGINTNLGQQLGSSYINRGNIWGNLVNNWTGQAAQAGAQALGGGFF